MIARRLEHITRMITRTIGEMLAKGEVSDPRIHELVTVHRTTVSKDLRRATVYVTGTISNRAMRKSVTGLNHAAGHIQSNINKHMRLHHVPRLKFVHDVSIRDGFEVIQKIEEYSQSP